MNKLDPRTEAVAEALYELDNDVERNLGIDYAAYGAEGMRGIDRYRIQAETAIAVLENYDEESEV